MLGLESLRELTGAWRRSLALVEGSLLSAVETVPTHIAPLVVGEGLCCMIRRWVLVHVLLEATRLGCTITISDLWSLPGFWCGSIRLKGTNRYFFYPVDWLGRLFDHVLYTSIFTDASHLALKACLKIHTFSIFNSPFLFL